MKTIKLLIVSFVLFLFALSAQARSGGNFGLGLVLGDPSGLSFKYGLDSKRAIDGALAFETHFHDHAVLQINHVWNTYYFPVDAGQLPLNLGLGGTLAFGHDFALGARGSGGITYIFPRAPLETFFTLGLIVYFLGEVDVDVDAGIGIRYFF